MLSQEDINMFRKISPQSVEHNDGYVVQVADRYAVEYFDKYFQARIDVDFGTSVGVYLRSLIIKDKNGFVINLTPLERDRIFERIVSGIEAMGSSVERL
jgi:hypothetical protein